MKAPHNSTSGATAMFSMEQGFFFRYCQYGYKSVGTYWGRRTCRASKLTNCTGEEGAREQCRPHLAVKRFVSQSSGLMWCSASFAPLLDSVAFSPSNMKDALDSRMPVERLTLKSKAFGDRVASSASSCFSSVRFCV